MMRSKKKWGLTIALAMVMMVSTACNSGNGQPAQIQVNRQGKTEVRRPAPKRSHSVSARLVRRAAGVQRTPNRFRIQPKKPVMI
ncbi:hypothetical protein [Paenibacillus sp. AN1007]|uniref:Uncharacterized protein n=1 Tax=Paenibacillus sp. AN1007 TaxID=3151385 RepID=A0AAU8NJ58_9BACL